MEVFQTLKRRGHPDSSPLTISDGWGGVDEAMIEVYGVVPEYGRRGRLPTRMKPGSDWMYLQMVKRRHVHGRVQGTKIGVIYGSKAEVTAHLGESTAYIERSNLTDHIGRLSERETYL